jgi:hypothetical protein
MKHLQNVMCGQLVRSFHYVKWSHGFKSCWNQAFWTILLNMKYGRGYVALNSRQIGNKNFCTNRSVKRVSNSRQIGSKIFCISRYVKLASNSHETRVKLAINHFPETGRSNSRQTCTCHFSLILCTNTCIFM